MPQADPPKFYADEHGSALLHRVTQQLSFIYADGEPGSDTDVLAAQLLDIM
jgi:hypothetical protein